MSSSYDELLESKNFQPFRLDHLTPRMLQIAKEELNEHENTRFSAIQQLRELVIKEKNLKCRTDDEFLLQFLRTEKFSVKDAFERLRTFYQTVKSFLDVFSYLDEEKGKKTFRSGVNSHFPYRDKEGAAVIYTKMSNWRPEELDIFSIMNCCLAVAFSAVDYPATQVCGAHVLADMKGTTFKHLRCFTPRFFLLVSKGFRGNIPVRYKSIHIINASAVFRYMWSVINIFLSEKLRKRVHFHDGNMENLHKFIPKEILPTEYGGDYPDFDPVALGSAELEKFLPKYLQIVRDGYIKN